MAKSLYQPFYWDDYLLATPELSFAQHGAYLLLIGLYWQNGGPLPNDLPKLQRILRANTRHECRELKCILEKYFKLNGEGAWAHERIDKDIARLQQYREGQAEKSKKATEARWGKKDTGDKSDIPTGTTAGMPEASPQASPEDCPESPQTKAKAKRDIKNISNNPLTPKGEGMVVEVLSAFDVFWNGYPAGRRMNKRRCAEIWRTRKLDEKADAVNAGLAAWCASEQWLKDGGKFIPYPQKFLNEERWDNPPQGSNGPVPGGGMAAFAANALINSKGGAE